MQKNWFLKDKVRDFESHIHELTIPEWYDYACKKKSYNVLFHIITQHNYLNDYFHLESILPDTEYR